MTLKVNVCECCTCVALFLRWWHGKGLLACLLLLRQRCLSQWTEPQGSNGQLELDLKQTLILLQYITTIYDRNIVPDTLVPFLYLDSGVVFLLSLLLIFIFWQLSELFDLDQVLSFTISFLHFLLYSSFNILYLLTLHIFHYLIVVSNKQIMYQS